MRLVRFVARAYSPIPQWGVLEGETVYATSGPALTRSGPSWRASAVEMLVPVTPTKIVCVGKNYAAHAAEMGGEVPPEPGLFLKGPNTLAQHGATVPYPKWSESFHFEGELALVIGKRMRRVAETDALKHVLGYLPALDLTARDKQKTDLQWFRAKGADGFCPVGPWIETQLDPADLRVITRVNGQTRQDASTASMVYPVAQVLSYVSQYLTLEPGDLVLTGTPEGVGPLQPGDQVQVEVAGAGLLETRIGDPA